MRKYFIYTLLIAFVATFSFTGCKQDCDCAVNELGAYEVLAQHLQTIDMDLNHVIKNANDQKFVMAAPADGNLSSKYIMDIRSATDFATGHIDGAVNVPFANILTAATSATKPILVVCYTGQTACYATSLLRLYGYHDAQALKWGMSGWNPTFDKWTPNIADIAAGHTNWTSAAAIALQTFGNPTVSSSTTDGAALLKERVETVVAEGFKGVNASDVLGSPGNYFINNYFSEADHTGFGHINGAYRVLPLGITDGSINNLDPSKQVVTYCYTGQTSAVITAFLRVLGYDAYSLKFGMNGLYNSNPAWTSNQWGGDSNPKNLTYTSN